jgi:asparaginyl-tRNA synthetase
VKEGEAEPKAEEETKEQPKVIPFDERKVNYKKDFFSKPAYLTVSGQLSVENFACGMGDVYTFGPTFRAENSNTTRHLAEFWMIEPEIAFADLSDVMDLAEDYVKYCIRYVMTNNADDVDFFNTWVDKGLKDRLDNVTGNEFKRLSYTDAIELLIEHVKDKKVKFDIQPSWGMDMGSEHERYLAEKVFKMPVCVFNYPKTFKAFYMRQNEDGKTVAAMDMLVPGIGELIGGSQREERLDRLDKAIIEKGLEIEPYWWYRESRMYGTQPHAGFGLGFERLVMMCTGVENIRDVIPFPRYPGNAEF